MMLRCLAILILVTSLEQSSTLILSDPGGNDSVTYPSSLATAEVTAIMRLSPNLRMSTSYPVINQIELCIKDDPAYRGCETKEARTHWFLQNAEVNIGRMKTALEDLDKIPPLNGLDAVIGYERILQRFYLNISRARLRFTMTDDISILEAPIEGIDPRQDCAENLKQIKEASSHQTATEAARIGWYNCMNTRLRTKVGDYPMAAWRTALRLTDIRETYQPLEE